MILDTTLPPFSIRNWFSPLQPLRKELQGEMEYTEYEPAAGLRNLVYCYWELRSAHHGASGQTYSIVADGCADLIFPLHADGEPLLSVSGARADSFTFDHRIHYRGIRFYPGAIHYFFGISLEGLAGKTADARPMLGEALEDLPPGLRSCRTIIERNAITDRFLSGRLHSRNFIPDERLLHSLEQIYTSAGNAAITDQVAEFISPRQQRRLFRQHIGLSPKEFSKIVRFQSMLSHLMHPAKQDFPGPAYYDQSHFIRDFKRYYGATPGRSFLVPL